jgi:hypothetical protein
MRWLRLSTVVFLVLLAAGMAPRRDTDHDGLPDALEQSLLTQFVPRFQVSRNDCAGAPARFTPGARLPTPEAADGTIYGQVTPIANSRRVEIHYYDLWSTDCGAEGHALDAEHVAALVEASGPDLATAVWHAQFWYAAAHEATVCDVSQIARAQALGAVSSGPEVWISEGKHAAFFAPSRCAHGCGNDACAATAPLSVPRIVNLGEPGHPMNGAVWAASAVWPLAAKMDASDFPPAMQQLAPPEGIALVRTGRHPMQGVIAISSHTADHLGDAQTDTTGALGEAHASTASALGTSVRHSWHALGHAAGGVVHFLGLGHTHPPATAAAPAASH